MTTRFKCESQGYRGVQPAPKFPLRNATPVMGSKWYFFRANNTTCQKLCKAEIPMPTNDSAQQPLPIHLHVLDIPVSILVRQPTLHLVLFTPYTLHRVLTLSDKPSFVISRRYSTARASGRHTPADKKRHATVARSKKTKPLFHNPPRSDPRMSFLIHII